VKESILKDYWPIRPQLAQGFALEKGGVETADADGSAAGWSDRLTPLARSMICQCRSPQ
jgi:hypothetical protein